MSSTSASPGSQSNAQRVVWLMHENDESLCRLSFPGRLYQLWFCISMTSVGTLNRMRVEDAVISLLNSDFFWEQASRT